MSFNFKRVFVSSIIGCLITAVGAHAQTGTVEVTASGGIQISDVSGVCTAVSDAAIAADASLTGAFSCDLSLSSAADVLVIEAMLDVTNGSLYNFTNAAAVPSDHSPPIAALFPSFPALVADSYITTPGGSAAVDGRDSLTGERLISFDSSNDGAQTNFQWGRLTLLPNADGVANATLSATIQTKNEPDPSFDQVGLTLSIAPAVVTPPPVTFQDILGDAENGVSTFNSTYGSDASITAANDAETYPEGVTLFVPSDAALANFARTLNVDDLLVVPAMDEAMLTAAAPATLVPLSGLPHELTLGSVVYGGGTVVDSFEADNGWVHVVDTVPVPEPSGFALLAIAMVGFASLRRRR